MLKKTGASSVISDDGYSVEFDREVIIYREGDHCMEINMSGAGKKILIITSNVRAWLSPHEKEIIEINKRKEIVNRLEKMIKFLGYDYLVI